MIKSKPSIKILLAALLPLSVLLLSACGGESRPSTGQTQQTDAKNPPPADTQDENIRLDLAVSGESDYTLVYDGTNKAVTALVEDFVKAMNDEYGISINRVAAAQAERDYGHEIVVGNVRPGADAVVQRVRPRGDFAICVSGDDWVLYATGDTEYTYLFDVLTDRILPDITNGNLFVESDGDFVYHESDLAGVGYAQYIRRKGTLSAEFLDQILERRQFSASDGTTLPYRLYLPSNYDPDKAYPVLLFLHGAGERGNDNAAQLKHVIPNLFNNQQDSPVFDSILIVPQCPSGQQWVDTPWANGNYNSKRVRESNELAAVLELLDSVGQEFSTDPDRCYVMGISMGGFGAWDLIMRHTDRFAGAVPMCGGADVRMAPKLVNFPIYTAHGSADTVVPPSGTQAMVKALEDAGSTAITYVELAGKGHEIWDEISANPAVINWLFQQNRAGRE